MDNEKIINLLADAEKYGYNNDIEQFAQVLAMRRKKDILKKHKFSITEVTEHRKTGDITRWRTHLPDKDGKKGKQIARKSKEDLEDALVEFYGNIEKAFIPTFDEIYKKWLQYYYDHNDSSPNTRDKYFCDYKRFFDGKDIVKKPITDITDTDIDDFFVDCIKTYVKSNGEKGLQYKAFTRLYGYVNGVFRYAFKNRIITQNPMIYLDKSDFRKICREPEEKTAETELIPDDVFNAILEQLYRDINDDPTCFAPYAVELCALTGMRVAEAAALKWEDINYNEGYIHICRSDKHERVIHEDGTRGYVWRVDKTKTKKSRKMPLDENIIKSLNRIKKAQWRNNIESEWVFPHQEYGWTHSSLISSCMKNKCKQLGLSRTYGIHAFRKTLNSNMIMANTPVLMCSSMLGNTPQVNRDYYSYDTSNLIEKRKALADAHSKYKFA